MMKSFSIKSVVAIFFVCQLAYATAKGCNHNSSKSSACSSSNSSNGVGGLLIPVETGSDYRIVLERARRGRSLVGFQLCLMCKCCAAGGDPTTCINMPCCFGINCDLPNKPFGVCSFVPNACNCTTCSTSSSSSTATTTISSSQHNLQQP